MPPSADPQAAGTSVEILAIAKIQTTLFNLILNSYRLTTRARQTGVLGGG
jgi:hypothetical protein